MYPFPILIALISTPPLNLNHWIHSQFKFQDPISSFQGHMEGVKKMLREKKEKIKKEVTKILFKTLSLKLNFM